MRKQCDCVDIPNGTIHKIAAVAIKNKQVLVVKAEDYPLFVSLGGGHEPNETVEECLNREVKEEASVQASNPKFLLRTHYTTHTGQPLIIDSFLIDLTGEPAPSSEIEKIAWIGRDYQLKLGTGLSLGIIPELIKLNLI